MEHTLQPRSLLDIASEKFAGLYICALKADTRLTDPERDIELWKTFPNLQYRAADCVYKHMHKKSSTLRPPIKAAILVPFSKEAKTLLTTLDLSGFALTENLLAQVLAAQRDTLRVIKAFDMDYTHQLDMYHVCKYLKDKKVQLTAMKQLCTNQIYLLMEPKFHAHQLRQSVFPMFTDIAFDPPYGSHASTSSLSGVFTDVGFEEDYMPIPTLTENMGLERFGVPSYAVYPPVKNVMPHLLSFMPNLEQLQVARDLNYDHFNHIPDSDELLYRITLNSPRLKVLDIWGWPKITDGRFLEVCHNNPTFTHLLLRDVTNIENIVDDIGRCENLTYLDVSFDTRERSPVEYQKPNLCLFNMVKNLEHLEYLDISGTNLHMTGNSNDIIPDDELFIDGRIDSDIVGLRGLHKELKVLGLYGCEHSGEFPTLPAKNIFSNCNEEQLVYALKVYLKRPSSLYQAMNDIYHLYRNNTVCSHAQEALVRLLEGMELHEKDNNLITAGTAAIFYLLRRVQADKSLRRHIARVLITSLENMYFDQIVVRNVALTLCQFDFASDVIDDYVRVMEYILSSMRLHNSDPFTNRVIIYLMNSMACYLSSAQRLRVGDIGAIKIIMKEIIRRRNSLEADRVLEACWSFLWNVTDETPKNCLRFIKADGLELMLSVYQLFPNELEIVRNMMGLLGNISEVKQFRRLIMEQPFVPTLLHLLKTIRTNMEVAYNVAAVLANLMSDGEKIWRSRNQKVSFKVVHNQIISSVNEWDLQGSRIINYHSLKPIIGLLYCEQSYASQLWAAWALANLLTTDNEKYGQIFAAEDGIEALVWCKKMFSKESNITILFIKIENKLRMFNPRIFDKYDMPKPENPFSSFDSYCEEPMDSLHIDDKSSGTEEVFAISDLEDNETPDPAVAVPFAFLFHENV